MPDPRIEIKTKAETRPIEELANRMDELRKKILDATPVEIKRIRLGQEQIIQQKEMAKNDKTFLRNLKDEWEQKLKLIKLEERRYSPGMAREELKAREEDIRTRIKSIGMAEKENTVYEKHLDLVEKFSGQSKIGVAESAGGGILSGVGGVAMASKLGWAGLAAYGGYQVGKFAVKSFADESNLQKNIERRIMLTADYNDTEVKTLKTADLMNDYVLKEQKHMQTRETYTGLIAGQYIEMATMTNRILGSTKEEMKFAEDTARTLRVRRGYTAEETLNMLPQYLEMAHIMGTGQARAYLPIIENAGARVGMTGVGGRTKAMEELGPVAAAYYQSIYARGIVPTAEGIKSVTTGFAELGDMFHGERGAGIVAGLAQGMAGGSDAARALKVRALMGKGMDYYQIQKALQSGDINDNFGTIMGEVQKEYGPVTPGSMGLLAAQQIFPTLSIPDFETIAKHYRATGNWITNPNGVSPKDTGGKVGETMFPVTHTGIETNATILGEKIEAKLTSGIITAWFDIKDQFIKAVSEGTMAGYGNLAATTTKVLLQTSKEDLEHIAYNLQHPEHTRAMAKKW